MSLRNGLIANTSVLRRDTPGRPNPVAGRCPDLRAEANLVTVPVNVFDSQNRVVNHLDPQFFRVFEDGVEQSIVAVGAEDVPASIGFVFDISASMGVKL